MTSTINTLKRKPTKTIKVKAKAKRKKGKKC